MPNADDFNKDYFENGVVTGKSGYTNYQWMPELTIKLAHNIIKYLGFKDEHEVLDFGCAKGYLVKALRILDIKAYGIDISKYAIEMADSEVRDYLRLADKNSIIPFDKTFDWLITKDVLEHMTEDALDNFLKVSRKVAKNSFHVIPLGDEKECFVIPAYELDVTHVLKKSKDWWINKFEKAGWKLKTFCYRVPGIKENWTSQYEKGNGFFVFE